MSYGPGKAIGEFLVTEPNLSTSGVRSAHRANEPLSVKDTSEDEAEGKAAAVEPCLIA